MDLPTPPSGSYSLSFTISSIIFLTHDDDDDDDDDDYNQVSPVCIAARGGSTLVKASSCSYSWMGGHKKCKVILSLIAWEVGTRNARYGQKKIRSFISGMIYWENPSKYHILSKNSLKVFCSQFLLMNTATGSGKSLTLSNTSFYQSSMLV